MTMPFVRRPFRQGSHSWITEQMFTLNDFSGGLNNVDPENTLADNEFTDTMNMRFVGNKLMEKRQGLEKFDSFAGYGFVDKYKPLLGEEMWVRASYHSGGANITFGNTANFKNFPIASNSVHLVRGVNYNGKYYYVDGKNFYCFDGVTYYKIVTEPSAFLTKDVTTTSEKIIHVDKIPEQTKVGDKIWFSSAILKNVSDEDAKKYGVVKTIDKIDRTANTVTLTANIGYTIDKGTEDAKKPIVFYEPSDKIYGEEVWDKENHLAYYKPCRQELADTLGGGVSYLPDKPRVIVVHANRLFLAGDEKSPNHVYMSSYSTQGSQTLYFPVSTSIAVKPNGKAVVDMFVFDNALIIGRNEDLYVLYGNTPYPATIDSSGTQFYIKQLDATTGFMAANCGSLINNYYIYLGYDGRFYALNSPTTYVEYLMTRPLPYKCDIYKAPFNFAKEGEKRVSSVAYRNEVYFSIGEWRLIEGTTSSHRVEYITIVYNYDNMAYTYYTAPFGGYLYTDGLDLYVAESYLHKWLDDSDTYYDCDYSTGYLPGRFKSIKSRLSTKKYDLNMSAVFKYFKRLILTTRAYKDMNSDIQVDFEVDYYKLTGDENNVVNSNYGTFGVSKWGKAYFGEIDVLKSAWLNLDIRGRSVKFTFSSIEIEDLDETDESKIKRNINIPMRIYDVNVLWGIRDVR